MIDMRIIFAAMIISSCVSLSACSSADARAKKLLAANSIIQRQVASDIAVKIDWNQARVTSSYGGFFYVCGEATLNRPDAGQLTLNNANQRFIVTVNSSTKAGSALFDGSNEYGPKYVFDATWRDKCASAR
ncbi:hypothetical protein [Thermomonas aquatica]|uniref:Lipoprotein n=1 Tax=Thermomonas aquatica TaxID=2202149 RepID=A0A5B7ZP16_9GAMM|nr:hypothetical protein [Thermomonas aquatica]QDA56469.1 hypothetical protein FHQ07_03655 [Thermomonas aquatica]